VHWGEGGPEDKHDNDEDKVVGSWGFSS
jgi:hypothetical protein